MKYNAVIFDLGFTLFTFENFTIKRYFETLNKGLEKMIEFLIEAQIIQDSDLFRKKFKKIRNRNFQRSLAKFKEATTADTLKQTCDALDIPRLDPETAHKVIMIYHFTEGAFWKLKSSAKPLLHELREENFKIGLLSNAPYHAGIQFLLDTHDLTQYFDVISTSAQIGFCKPDKRTFEYILKKLQSAPERTVMIGDDLKNDIYGAQQMGMKAIYVQKDFHITPNGPVNVSPDGEVTDLNEILPIIRGWNNS